MKQESIKINGQGRIVVPANMRERLGLKGGDTLVIRLDEQGEQLQLSTPLANLRRLQRRLAERHGGDGRSWSDELIAERRREARKEWAEFEEQQRVDRR